MRLPRLPLLALPLLALGCGSESTSPDPTVASIAFTPAALDTLFSLGETAQLAAAGRDASGSPVPGSPVSYRSSAAAVASVGADGLVTAVANGSAFIVAAAGGVSDSVPVRVRQKLARVVVLPGTAGVVVGRTVTLAATPQDARGNAIAGLPGAAFSSDAQGVARVDGAGVVTGVSPGIANVSATVTSPADGARSAAAVVTVASAPPAAVTVDMGAVTFNPPSVDVAVGGTVTWVNGSGVAHDVDFGTPAMRTDVFASGQRSFTFGTAGSFGYHCNLHAGMTGTVVVR